MTSPVSAIEAIEKADRIWAYTNGRGSRVWTPMKPVIAGAHEEQEYVLADIHSALARQAEALQREVDSLKQTRQHSREASAALHDAFMEERKRVEALQRENAELRAFAASFKLTCVESSFYKDCYLHISEPDSVSFRLGNGSQFSKFIAGLEDRRARALLGGSENAE